MSEQSYAIGLEPQLVGIYTQAASDPQKAANKAKPTILLVNSGLLNRTGPFGQYVRMAREFALHGFSTFRFDLSGIGDSDRRNDNRSADEHAMQDIKEVMSFLEQQNNDKNFIIMGICTGADNAHRAMLKHKKIIGAVSIDGYCYPTFKYYFNYYYARLWRLSCWLNLLKSLFVRFGAVFIKRNKKQDFESFDFEWILPTRSKTSADFNHFIQRNAYLLNVFTASWPCNYDEQLADALPNVEFGDNIKSVYIENAEHTFPFIENRSRLSKIIVNWLEQHF